MELIFEQSTGTIRLRPGNYWVCSTKGGPGVIWDSYEAHDSVRNIDRKEVERMWKAGEIPTK